MTLRIRLLLVLVGVMAIGLVVSDVAVYSQLRSYLLAQVDPQLRAASRQVERVVLTRDGLIRRVPARTGVGSPESATSGSSTSGSPTSVPQGGLRPLHSVAGADRKGTHGGLVPSGTVGELVGADGRLVGSPVFFSYGGKAPPPPLLPHPLPLDTGSGAALFSARSGGPDAVTYRVLVRPLHSQGFAVAVAVPLTEVSGTLGRLALVMVLVSAAVLIGLGLLALWMVRQGLRPLDDMAVAAGAIAGGDLGRRVTPAGGRTEIGRLGEALNTMLTEIEDAFAARAASEGRLRRFLADASHELR
ncbi:MAG: HAMP domain-containing protein, partial [Actinomycetota bacterium]|nr:HAMP domain-containing protein [Actinomycetota bacterium]